MNQQQLKQQLIARRHYLHAHPESAFEEQNTSRFIAESSKLWALRCTAILAKPGWWGD